MAVLCMCAQEPVHPCHHAIIWKPHVFAPPSIFPANWSTRNVGTQDITMYATEEQPGSSSSSVMSMFQSLAQQVADMQQREAYAQQPRVRNTAAQVLLHACGHQSFRQTSADWFTVGLGAAHAGVQALASSMSEPSQDVVQQADAVIMRCNAQMHSSSLEALEEEVEAVQRCITPALEQMCAWECKLLKAYPDIKRAFPGRFS